jgi:hypothetical protein
MLMPIELKAMTEEAVKEAINKIKGISHKFLESFKGFLDNIAEEIAYIRQ